MCTYILYCTLSSYIAILAILQLGRNWYSSNVRGWYSSSNLSGKRVTTNKYTNFTDFSLSVNAQFILHTVPCMSCIQTFSHPIPQPPLALQILTSMLLVVHRACMLNHGGELKMLVGPHTCPPHRGHCLEREHHLYWATCICYPLLYPRGAGPAAMQQHLAWYTCSYKLCMSVLRTHNIPDSIIVYNLIMLFTLLKCHELY